MAYNDSITRSNAAPLQGGRGRSVGDYKGKDGTGRSKASYGGYDGAGRKGDSDAPDGDYMIPEDKRFPLSSPGQCRIAYDALHAKQFRQKYSHQDLAAMERRLMAAFARFDKPYPPSA